MFFSVTNLQMIENMPKYFLCNTSQSNPPSSIATIALPFVTMSSSILARISNKWNHKGDSHFCSLAPKFCQVMGFDSLFILDILKYLSVSQSVSSLTKSCPTLCNTMNRSTPGLPVHHQLLEFTQTHLHRVSDAIQPSHSLSSPFPPASNPSQHQSLCQ